MTQTFNMADLLSKVVGHKECIRLDYSSTEETNERTNYDSMELDKNNGYIVTTNIGSTDKAPQLMQITNIAANTGHEKVKVIENMNSAEFYNKFGISNNHAKNQIGVNPIATDTKTNNYCEAYPLNNTIYDSGYEDGHHTTPPSESVSSKRTTFGSFLNQATECLNNTNTIKLTKIKSENDICSEMTPESAKVNGVRRYTDPNIVTLGRSGAGGYFDECEERNHAEEKKQVDSGLDKSKSEYKKARKIKILRPKQNTDLVVLENKKKIRLGVKKKEKLDGNLGFVRTKLPVLNKKPNFVLETQNLDQFELVSENVKLRKYFPKKDYSSSFEIKTKNIKAITQQHSCNSETIQNVDPNSFPTFTFNKKNCGHTNFCFKTPLGEYKLLKTLGKGSYGKVKLAVNLLNQQKVAVKIIKRNIVDKNDKESPEYKKAQVLDKRVIREANLSMILGQLHPHITKLYDFRMTKTHFYMFYEFVNGPTLAERIGEFGVCEDEARELFRSIAKTIAFCHSYSIVHRDIKLENILIDYSQHSSGSKGKEGVGTVKLIDFGLANFYEQSGLLSTFCGSLPYTAPEILKGQPYTGPEIDIWSLGVLLYTMVTGKFPFMDPSQPKNFKKVNSGSFKLPKMLSEEIKELLCMMIHPDMKKRFNIEQVLLHPWLNYKNIPKNQNFGAHKQMNLFVDEIINSCNCGLSMCIGNKNRMGNIQYCCKSCESNTKDFNMDVNKFWTENKRIDGMIVSEVANIVGLSTDKIYTELEEFTKASDNQCMEIAPVKKYTPIVSLYFLVARQMELHNWYMMKNNQLISLAIDSSNKTNIKKAGMITILKDIEGAKTFQKTLKETSESCTSPASNSKTLVKSCPSSVVNNNVFVREVRVLDHIGERLLLFKEKAGAQVDIPKVMEQVLVILGSVGYDSPGVSGNMSFRFVQQAPVFSGYEDIQNNVYMTKRTGVGEVRKGMDLGYGGFGQKFNTEIEKTSDSKKFETLKKMLEYIFGEPDKLVFKENENYRGWDKETEMKKRNAVLSRAKVDSVLFSDKNQHNKFAGGSDNCSILPHGYKYSLRYVRGKQRRVMVRDSMLENNGTIGGNSTCDGSFALRNTGFESNETRNDISSNGIFVSETLQKNKELSPLTKNYTLLKNKIFSLSSSISLKFAVGTCKKDDQELLKPNTENQFVREQDALVPTNEITSTIVVQYTPNPSVFNGESEEMLSDEIMMKCSCLVKLELVCVKNKFGILSNISGMTGNTKNSEEKKEFWGVFPKRVDSYYLVITRISGSRSRFKSIASMIQGQVFESSFIII
ncbi:hypothetical protein BB558_005820 [Smittium angustum]|uniref:Protein kinase domain-containing protein n=1 Tax=Smittium angustum TaxID=133377 RepID=A0A2U1IZE5_SMIAN|nr:hypothetical protein BB558_005820 [Smittium angustum]